MKEPTAGTSWAVIILLAIAAIDANMLAFRGYNEFGPLLLIILSAICGVLALRYEGRGQSLLENPPTSLTHKT
jgi:UPF0716 family protein affecting phage T7 exclusion